MGRAHGRRHEDAARLLEQGDDVFTGERREVTASPFLGATPQSLWNVGRGTVHLVAASSRRLGAILGRTEPEP
jgi:hypothetical protein